MWPLLKRDGLGLEYCASAVGWNVLIGYNPLHLDSSFVKYLSLVSLWDIVSLQDIYSPLTC